MPNEHTPALFKFAFFIRYEEDIKNLAENLADLEPWDFPDSKEKRFAILKNYLQYYYQRLKEENKIFFTKNNEYCIFNTGLVTRNQEDIFAFFEKNRKTDKPGFAPYFFKSFNKHSDPILLEKFGGLFPEPAYFFEKPDLLLINPKYAIVPDIEHIIEDNKSRFPTHLQNADNAELRRQIKGAIDDVTKKVRTNYKIAIPQYFDGKVQLLLPLCLTSGSPNPDLALVVSKIQNQEIYSAKTCLTLKMAYNNARLIVKPQSEWLRP